ncbi:MAG: hypothetical protein AAGG01_22650, partial [Planctomycetota bacterium]
MLRPIIALIPLLLSFLLAPAATAQGGGLDDLKHEIDFSVRWLRSTQNPEAGSYGGGVEGTAWALYALAKGPRKYVRADGPFVAKALDFLVASQGEDGSIADDGAKGADRLQQTQAAAAALSVLVDKGTAPALGKAAVWLAGQGVDSPSMDEIAMTEAPEKLGLELLGRRKGDGSFDGPRGAVIETSRAICALAAVKKKLKPEPSAEASAKAL